VLDDLRRSNHKSLEALLRDARPVGVEAGNVVVLSFRYSFHSGKVQEVSNQIAVEKALGRVLGAPCKVRCIVEESAEAKLDRARGAPVQNDPVVTKALRIFRAHIMSPSEIAAVESMQEMPVSAVLDGLEGKE
jgi:hypothetical protein